MTESSQATLTRRSEGWIPIRTEGFHPAITRDVNDIRQFLGSIESLFIQGHSEALLSLPEPPVHNEQSCDSRLHFPFCCTLLSK